MDDAGASVRQATRSRSRRAAATIRPSVLASSCISRSRASTHSVVAAQAGLWGASSERLRRATRSWPLRMASRLLGMAGVLRLVVSPITVGSSRVRGLTGRSARRPPHGNPDLVGVRDALRGEPHDQADRAVVPAEASERVDDTRAGDVDSGCRGSGRSPEILEPTPDPLALKLVRSRIGSHARTSFDLHDAIVAARRRMNHGPVVSTTAGPF